MACRRMAGTLVHLSFLLQEVEEALGQAPARPAMHECQNCFNPSFMNSHKPERCMQTRYNYGRPAAQLTAPITTCCATPCLQQQLLTLPSRWSLSNRRLPVLTNVPALLLPPAPLLLGLAAAAAAPLPLAAAAPRPLLLAPAADVPAAAGDDVLLLALPSKRRPEPTNGVNFGSSTSGSPLAAAVPAFAVSSAAMDGGT